MAVSKRLRYEILRRDNYSCRYCGASAPDVRLTVDHVTPVSLGGRDEAGNLVAACVDCNAGKSSSNPDAPLVGNVSDDAIRWSKAIQRASELRQKTREAQFEFYKEFILTAQRLCDEDPTATFPSLESAGSPSAAFRSVIEFHNAGLDRKELLDAMLIAMTNQRISEDDIWKYFCGICWRKVDELHASARALIETGDV